LLEIIEHYWYKYVCRWEASNYEGEQVQNRREGWGEENMGHDTVQETRPDPCSFLTINLRSRGKEMETIEVAENG
jgi:hypothetical protein